MALLHMEGFGLVDEGEVGSWVRAGKNGLDGETPVNTHGGLLSEGYMHGLNHVLEGVRQMRGTSTSQVPGAEVCLVTGRGQALNCANALVLRKG
jgi:acetyl-CoA acetyltransferase